MRPRTLPEPLPLQLLLLRLVQCRPPEGRTATFGHNGAGDGLGYFCTRSGCGVAVTVNQMGDCSVTRAVLGLLGAQLGVRGAREWRS
jgi:hypothetical protein